MTSSEWEWCLNRDDSLYFYPISHTIEGNYRIKFELSGSYNLRVSDVELSGKPILLFEYFDDDDRPASIGFIESKSTIENMIEHLNGIDSIYHDPIYKSVYEWALKLFYRK